MLSKEEIWNNNVSGWKLSMTAKGHANSMNAMEEYGKQLSINFHKWVVKNYWPMGDNEWMETGSDRRYTVEELYELYLKQ